MKKIQIYASDALQKRLEDEATKSGTTESALVNDILLRHYGLIPTGLMTISELTKQVLDEVKAFIANRSPGDEPFDLLSASPTFAKIEMVCFGKPSVSRAKIGKAFAGEVGKGDFAQVEVNRVKGKIVRNKNNAATYIIKKSDDD